GKFAVRARDALAEGAFFAGCCGVDHALTFAQAELHRIRDAGARARIDHDAIDDQVDVVLRLLVECDHAVVERNDRAVDAQARKSARSRVQEQLAVLALTLPFEWRIQHEFGPFGVLQDRGHDLLRRLSFGFAPTLAAELNADARVQHAQVVVHFRDGADGRTRVAGSGLLLDRDRRRKPADGVVLRLVHLAEELARIAGQAFDVTALPFRVDGVEGQRRLAAPGHAGDHHQALLGNREGNVFEVVLARAAHDDRFRVSLAHPWAVARLVGVVLCDTRERPISFALKRLAANAKRAGRTLGRSGSSGRPQSVRWLAQQFAHAAELSIQLQFQLTRVRRFGLGFQAFAQRCHARHADR